MMRRDPVVRENRAWFFRLSRIRTAASNSFLAIGVNASESRSALRWNALSAAVSGLG
jgi:hypothetical protein